MKHCIGKKLTNSFLNFTKKKWNSKIIKQTKYIR